MDLSTAKLGPRRGSGHVCYPYESVDQKLRTVVTFVRDGLAGLERCLFIGSPAEQAEIVTALDAAGVSTEGALHRGALVLTTNGETYLRSGRIDPEDSLLLMEGLVDRALADGFVGLRATGEGAGPLPAETWPLIRSYEARLNERLGRRPFTALCRFNIGRTTPERMQEVLRLHPHVLVRGDVCANPFYERPEVALGDDNRARLEWQLHQLRATHRARKRLAVLAAASQGEGVHDRFLSALADELTEPVLALERELKALGAALGETPASERVEVAQHHLRRLSSAVAEAREVARLVERGPIADGDADEARPRRPRGS